MFAQPFLGSVPKNTFFLNPKHQNFVSGDERKFKDFTSSTLIVLSLVILLFGVIGGGMAYTGFDEIVTRSALEQTGVEARATVIDTDYSTSTSKGSTTYTYYMTYEYFVRAEGSDTPARYTYHQQISSDNYLEFNNGSKISVRYLPDNPSVSRYMEDNSGDGKGLALIGGLIVVGVLMGVYIIVRQRSRNRKLENEGQMIMGKIVQASGSRVKGGFQVNINYGFTSPDGAELSRKESLTRRDINAKTLPAVGTPVAVIYVNNRLFRVL